MLGDGQGDAGDVYLLKSVLADERSGHLASDGHYRRRVHVRRSDAGHQVGGPRPRGGHADPYFARGPRVAVGSVSCGLFVAHQDVMDRVFRQGMIEMDDRPS